MIKPKSKHTYTIIFLHGRGSSGQEFAEELFECQFKDAGHALKPCTFSEALPGLKWIFPSAPLRHSATFQECMPQWFDIYSLSNPDDQQETQLEGLSSSVRMVQELIDAELTTTHPDGLFLGGISQGAATGMMAMISMNLKLNGFIGLSGWLPCSNILSKGLSQRHDKITAKVRSLLGLDEQPDKNQRTRWPTTPIFLGHEKHDSIVSIEHGRQACELLQGLGAAPEWHEYKSGDHWIQEPDEAQDILRFLQRQMSRA